MKNIMILVLTTLLLASCDEKPAPPDQVQMDDTKNFSKQSAPEYAGNFERYLNHMRDVQKKKGQEVDTIAHKFFVKTSATDSVDLFFVNDDTYFMVSIDFTPDENCNFVYYKKDSTAIYRNNLKATKVYSFDAFNSRVIDLAEAYIGQNSVRK